MTTPLPPPLVIVPINTFDVFISKEKAEEYNSALKIFKESPQFSNWLMKPLQFEPPVDTNGAPVATRLGWVPLHSLPDHVPIHLLNAYPPYNNI
ncbi:Adenosine deaminase/editase [Artemisia annua]|uniref:Adenosine deaminase/editase n=1 Tax=Artemisia annua TaxID=35608 RepID=A0A2U1NMU3_ARTAN|nr:Adenosine deaminase/editase [Artemisia annua]